VARTDERPPGRADDATPDPPGRRPAGVAGPREFVAIVATCMAMAALSIDLMLPAFPEMREAFGLDPGSTEVSLVITALFLGLAAGQLVYGPLSDRYGRKPLLYVGLAIYAVSAAAAAVMPTLTGVVICRVLWGLGAAAPRSLALAMIRDRFSGDHMARTMSHVMATFILVPVFAPSVGAAIMLVAPWRTVMWVPVVVACLLALWLRRLPETLPPADRRSVAPSALLEALREVLRSRQTLAFGIAVTCLFGMMTSYVGSSEVIIDEVFGQGDLFPVIFGLLAVMLGLGSLLNARLVMRLGLLRVVRTFALYIVGVAGLLLVVAVATDGHPPLWAFCVCVALLLPSVSLLTPNSNTLAMAPLPHVAGMAAAVLGTLSTAGGAVLGSIVDSAFDGSILPFAVCALVYSSVAAGAILVLGRGAVTGASGARDGSAVPAGATPAGDGAGVLAVPGPSAT